MSNHLRIYRGPERRQERLAKIAAAVAVQRIDRLPPPERPGEYRNLCRAFMVNIGSPTDCLTDLIGLLDDGERRAA